jgi:hypothetical protein
MSESEVKKIDLPLEVKQELKEYVEDWLKADDGMKTLNDKIKIFKQEKKESEERILEIFDTYNMQDGLTVNNTDKLRKSKSVTKAPLKPDTVSMSIKDIVKKEDIALQITKHIFENRPKQERFYLKRTGPRKKKDEDL